MADREGSHGAASSAASETGEPAQKRPKGSPVTKHGLRANRTDQSSCASAVTEAWEPAVKCMLPAEKKAKPAMAVEQATAAALEVDNNGLQVPDSKPPKAAGKANTGPTLTPAEDGADFPGEEDLLSNGVGDTPEHISEEDDRLSHASSSDWTPQPQIGSYSFIQQHIRESDPRTILKELLPETVLPPDLDDMTLWQIIINISDPPKRRKRKDVNTLEDVVRLLHESKRILVLTGAGVSVSCGIPDFRSRDGIYARLAADFPNLPDPQAMFDIEYFRQDPRPFFKFAKEIFPGQFQPSLCHRFISMLEKQRKLLRNYTQNIDTLEQVAGIQQVIQCHGSFATASCLVCKHQVDCEAIREDIFNQVVPHCPQCQDTPLAIMKPNIVFFGENLPEVFHRAMKQDKDEVDLLIVIGSSLKVRPVALIPNSIPHEVPQVLINREQLPHLNFDVELLGDCDVIVNEICHRLGGDFEQLCYNTARLLEITEKPPRLSRQMSNAAVDEKNSDPLEEQQVSDPVTWPSEETDVTGTAGHTETPTKPCHKAESHYGETAESSQSREDAFEKDESKANSRISNSENPSRRTWMTHINRSPISKRLEAGQFLFQAPNHYIFHGAEVYTDSEDETSSSCGSDSVVSECSANGMEEDSETEDITRPADGETFLRDAAEHAEASESTSSLQKDQTS